MSISLRSILCLSCVLATSVGIEATSFQPEPKPNAQPEAPRREGEGRRGPGGEGGRPPSLEGSMKSMNRAFRTLSSQVEDPEKVQENLQLITELQRACVIAKGIKLPADMLAAGADDQAKKAIELSFRTRMIASLRLMIDAEEMLLAGKLDEAKSKVNALAKLRDDGHKEMGVKDD